MNFEFENMNLWDFGDEFFVEKRKFRAFFRIIK